MTDCSLNESLDAVLSAMEDARKSEQFESVLSSCEQLLQLDPNNSQLLEYKFTALCWLGKQYDDIGFLRKYCWYRSIDYKGFEALSQAYREQGQNNDEVIALAFALSVAPNNQRLRNQLHDVLKGRGYSAVKIGFLTINRIGHLSVEPDSWLRKKSLGQTHPDCLYLFVSNGDPANAFCYELIKSHLTVVETPYWHKLFTSRIKLLAKEFYEPMPYDLLSVRRMTRDTVDMCVDVAQVYQASHGQLKLGEKAIEQGWSLLKKHGVHPDSKFVCLHVRDSAYLDKTLSHINVDYHDIRDMDIANFRKAVVYLIAQGYHVIRIGAATNQSLALADPNYHDLCLNRDAEYGDFLEVFVVSQCTFYFGTSSGPVSLAACFDKPVLEVNVTPYVPFYSSQSRFIPKYYLNDASQAIPFRAMFDGMQVSMDNLQQDLLNCHDGKKLYRNGIRFQENSEDDILESIVEFESQAKSGQLNAPLSELQRFYKEQIPANRWFKKCDCILTDSFIRRNLNLFTEVSNER